MEDRISKWYLAQGNNVLGNYISIKEEDTDLIVSCFNNLTKEQSNFLVNELTFMVNPSMLRPIRFMRCSG